MKGCEPPSDESEPAVPPPVPLAAADSVGAGPRSIMRAALSLWDGGRGVQGFWLGRMLTVWSVTSALCVLCTGTWLYWRRMGDLSAVRFVYRYVVLLKAHG
jgi:hypothetical protein